MPPSLLGYLSNFGAGREARGSPVLPVLAQQDTDTLVQCGPVGLVREEGQEVGSERGHLGARLTFALERKEWSLCLDGPCRSHREQRNRAFQERTVAA